MYKLHIIKVRNSISIEFYKKIKNWICEGTKFYSKLYQTIYLQNSTYLFCFVFLFFFVVNTIVKCIRNVKIFIYLSI